MCVCGVGVGAVWMWVWLRRRDRKKIVIIIFVPNNVLYDNHMCVMLFILHRTSISNTNSIQIMLVAFVFYSMRLDCKSLIHVNVIPLFVIDKWHPHFPLNRINKTST